MNNFVRALRSGQILLMDGAMGTELQRLQSSAERVHASYVAASADVLLTNTFQTHAPDRLHADWQAAIRAAASVLSPLPRWGEGRLFPTR